MRRLLLVGAMVLSAWCAPADAQDVAYEGTVLYEGTWNTTNRKLDGTMACAVTGLGDGKWRGRFYGVWQGVPFDYTVMFSGTPSNLTGTATIDGANYTWTGEMGQELPGRFKGSFGGSRYAGYFDLQEKKRVSR